MKYDHGGRWLRSIGRCDMPYRRWDMANRYIGALGSGLVSFVAVEELLLLLVVVVWFGVVVARRHDSVMT